MALDGRKGSTQSKFSSLSIVCTISASKESPLHDSTIRSAHYCIYLPTYVVLKVEHQHRNEHIVAGIGRKMIAGVACCSKLTFQ
eukprot:scaffold3163_cov134-Skeletonema_menzelii.AAC.4